MRLGLGTKIALTMVLTVLVPLLVSTLLVDQLSRVAANFNAEEAESRIAPMESGAEAVRQLFDVTKRLHSEVAARLAQQPVMANPTTAGLRALQSHEPDLQRLAVLHNGVELAAAERKESPGPTWRTKRVEYPMPVPPGSADERVLQLDFWVPATLQNTLLQLGESVDRAKHATSVRAGLPGSYRWAFLALLGISTVAAAVIGFGVTRRITQRLAGLVSVARRVSSGERAARASAGGHDEVGELGVAFNRMLDDVSAKNEQIEYLQRIGAWQEVARRLAHEIKNPLSPIQLSVQQCVSSYRGDDAAYRAMLEETGHIVEEEIDNLRRLVDTFRTLGQLPKVDPKPLAMRDLMRDLELESSIAAHITTDGLDVSVYGDRLLLRRLLVNLVENGVHAGAERGDPRVHISWRAHGSGVRVFVDDHGGGIASSARQTVFEPYVTTKREGTGLGLPIAKKIALEHGGNLAVAELPAPSGGARLVLDLPGATP